MYNSGCSFEDAYIKFQTISGSVNATDLIQGKQDINIGYKRFNAAIARYFTRKQQFADIVAGQQIYQTPIDAIRVNTVVTKLSNGYQYPLEQIRSEQDWRWFNIYQYSSSYIQYYFVIGNNQIGLYPVPSYSLSGGLRLIYQPQDVDLTQDDYKTGTVAVANDGVSVTGTGTTWTANMVGRMFQLTDGSDGNWYQVTAVTSPTSLTIQTPCVAPSDSGANYRIGQVFIFPSEYDDVPVDYALARYFESRNNSTRAAYHRQNFDSQVNDAVEKYSSSSTSNVITEDTESANLWLLPPMPGS